MRAPDLAATGDKHCRVAVRLSAESRVPER
jgi:hypothetical protein